MISSRAEPCHAYIAAIFGWGGAIAAGLFAIGCALCVKPALDLLCGPTRLHDILAFDVAKSHGSGAKISATLRTEASDGAERQLDFTGWTATDAEERLSPCLNREGVQITVLRHLERVIDVRCL